MTAPRLRIAVLNRHFGKRFGGAEHYSVAVVEELAPHHEVHVFAQDMEEQVPGVHHHRISRPLVKPRWLNQLWFALSSWLATRHGFDTVISHENIWHGDIQTVHVRPFRTGLFHQRQGWRRSLKWLGLFTSPRLLTYWCLEKARMSPRPGRRIVATSESVRDEILQAYPAVAGILSTIPPGVRVPSCSPDPRQLRRELGIPVLPTLALFVGNDYLKKGLPALLNALVDLPDIHLAVAGQTTHLAICQQQAQALGVASRVHFLGSRQDMSKVYGAADFLVHPTTEDTYAMAVLEAMAHGLPVIVSGPRHCGIAAELTDGDNALILQDPYNHFDLQQLIARLQNTPMLCSALAAAGRSFARERSWSRTAQCYAAMGTSKSRAASAKT